MFKLKKDRKGLIHIMEFITSFIVFIVLLGVFFATAGVIYSKLAEENKSYYLDTTAIRIAENLVSSPGYTNYSIEPFFYDCSYTTPKFIDQGLIIIGEAGSITLANTIDNGVEAKIKFKHTYNKPVVVPFIMTRNDDDSVDVRVKDVSSTGCTIFMEEPDNSGHGAEDIGYIVMEEGTYTLLDGTHIEAGSVITSSVHIGGNSFGGETVLFTQPFTSTPIVLHALNTYNNGEFMSSIAHTITTTSFTVQQEAAETGVSFTTEKIGWIAIDSGVLSDLSSVPYETGIHPLDGDGDGVDNTAEIITFTAGFTTPPIVIVKGQTATGPDGYWARGSGTRTTTQQGVYAEEDQVGDNERGHADTGFGWIAIGKSATFIAVGSANGCSIDDGRLKHIANETTWLVTTRSVAQSGNIVYGIKFLSRNMSSEFYALAIFNGSSILAPQNLVGIYHRSSEDRFSVVIYRDGSLIMEDPIDEIPYLPDQWYRINIKKNISGIITISLEIASQSEGIYLDYYVPLYSWDTFAGFANIKGICLWDNYYEYEAWEEYGQSIINNDLASIGLARDINTYGKISIEKIFKFSSALNYDYASNMFGLDGEKVNITIRSRDNVVTYMSWGRNYTTAKEMGSAIRQVEIYSGGDFVNVAILEVRVFI